MFAISPTDHDWFNFLKSQQLNSFVNFWTPTPWNIKGLKKGNKLYFMLKSPVRKIAGFGEFVEYKNMSVENAWNEYGYRNGRSSKLELIHSLDKYIKKHSEKFSKEGIQSNSYQIGCIILKNCEFWDNENFKDLNDYAVSFPSQVVTIKYFNQYDFLDNGFINTSFKLLNEPRDNELVSVKIRSGQSVFKGQLLKAYNNSCCISGETIPELLEAAHIQSYKNKDSNHVQNGLLMRVDLHKLYDNNLIYIDETYTVHISSSISNSLYKQYDKTKIMLPNSNYEYPSVETLVARKDEFRK